MKGAGRGRSRGSYKDTDGAPLMIGGRHVCACGSCRRVIPDGARYCATHEAALAREASSLDVQPRERFEMV